MIEGQVENRKACRYDAVRSSVYVGWWDEMEFQCHAAELGNLSLGGALVDLPVPPPSDRALYLCMGDASTSLWAESALVSLSEPSGGGHRARLSFSEPCVHEMFNLAVFGLPASV